MRRISSGACSSGRRSPSRGRAQVLTDRGRWILAFGGGVYLAAWGFGSEALYPIALGLVLAVATAALWVRFLSRPLALNRSVTGGEHFAGDDIPVRLEVDVDGRIPSGALVVRERIARLGERETVMVNRRGRPTGFALHSVRDYQQGESLRRVHWPSTAKRGHLMVKELEDAPREETAVLLDADATAVAGVPPDTSFELQVRAAGSILKAHARRGRRAALIINSATRPYQRVHSFDGEWLRALELLAAVEPDGPTPVAAMLPDEAGPAGRALELTVVTASLTARLVDRLLQRMLSRHAATLVYVERASFAGEAGPLDPATGALVLRLQRGGVPVAVLRRG